MSSKVTADKGQLSFFQDFVRLILQYARFGVVGIVASVVHVGLFVFSIEIFGLWEIYANILGFSVAVCVSYFGNLLWTFNHVIESNKSVVNKSYLVRFWFVAILGLLLNTLIVYLISEVYHLEYYYSVILMVTATPVVIFTLNKVWVFRK